MKLWLPIIHVGVLFKRKQINKGEETKDADAAEVQRIEIQTTVKKKAGAWIWRGRAFSDTIGHVCKYWSVIHQALMARVEMETVHLSKPALIGRRDPRKLTLSLLRDHRTSQLSPISHSKTLPYFHKRFESIFLSPITHYKNPSRPPFTSLLPP